MNITAASQAMEQIQVILVFISVHFDKEWMNEWLKTENVMIHVSV
jgi:hypothetical protein